MTKNRFCVDCQGWYKGSPWLHVCQERTNEYARSPQEPVVHQSCDQQTNSEQSGVFVQGGKEPTVREAVDVHQSAASIFEAIAIHREHLRWQEEHHRRLADFYANEFEMMRNFEWDKHEQIAEKQQAQCEAVDGERAAAD
jgi:hypothetical protein